MHEIVASDLSSAHVSMSPTLIVKANLEKLFALTGKVSLAKRNLKFIGSDFSRAPLDWVSEMRPGGATSILRAEASMLW